MRFENMPDGFYWSPSRHNLAKNCPWCFVRKYMYKVPYEKPKSKALDYGSYFHDLREGKKILEDKIVEEYGPAFLNSLYQHGRDFDRYAEKLKFTDDDVKEFEANTTLMRSTGESFPVPFYGIMDRLLYHAGSTVRGYVDYKTSAKEWSQRQLDEDDQFTYYWMAYQSLFQKEPDAFAMIFVKAKEPYAVTRRIRRTQDQCDNLFDRALELYNQYVVDFENVEQKCKRHIFCPYPA